MLLVSLLTKRVTSQATEKQILFTGIKVVDLLAPYQKGGKIGLYGGAGVGKKLSLLWNLLTMLQKLMVCAFNFFFLTFLLSFLSRMLTDCID